MTPRSCETSTIAIPSPAWNSISSARICSCVVTSSAVVGSSASSSLRPRGDRHRDHHPLAHAAAELVRVGARRCAGDGTPTRSSSSIARLRASRFAQPRALAQRLDHLVADREDRVEARRSGPGRSSRSPQPRRSPEPLLGAPQQVLALPADLAAEDLARIRDEPEQRAQGHALAAARLADEARASARPRR